MTTLTIQLGTHKTKPALLKALEDYKVSSWAKDLIKSKDFKIEKPRKIDPTIISVKELGFPEGATYKEICERAKEKGLELCPAEVGPQLRLQSDFGEWLTIAMNPITDSDGYPRVFRVVRDEGVRWLDAVWGGPEHFWLAGGAFVFASSFSEPLDTEEEGEARRRLGAEPFELEITEITIKLGGKEEKFRKVGK